MDYDEKLKAAEEKLKKAEAVVKRIKALNDKKTRAEDTRKKILAGAALLNHINKQTDPRFLKHFHELLEGNLNNQDFSYLISKVEALKIPQ